MITLALVPEMPNFSTDLGKQGAKGYNLSISISLSLKLFITLHLSLLEGQEEEVMDGLTASG